ncbi:autotransporter outer membrane beta-barrel domain-containing protein [Microvirga terricola]|uniref:Autotransporter domain-containing protein n=1 Tax=Microvirga terricola TaxID=2719797 RepID=A0ABX0VF08_9HYPH|nr:autotransporter domain-containing protein [Microvirga terricola]NIX78429.1 autotransporter domain-containing protein [Microvirga terricola]
MPLLAMVSATLLIGCSINTLSGSSAFADIMQVDGAVDGSTPISKTPFPILPINTLITKFTSYDGPFPYVLGTFTVNRTGSYLFTLATPSVENGIYLLNGMFSPSSAGTPSTDLSKFFAFSQNLGFSTIGIGLKAGVQYSYLAIFSPGSSPFTFTLKGPACIALGSDNCWIDASKPFFTETDGEAEGEVIVFDGGTLSPSTTTVLTQPVTLRASGGVIDATSATSVTLSGDISGAGHLAIKGGNTVVLTGTNTYTGGTTISASTVIGSATSFGTGRIRNDGVLIFDQTADGTLSNVMLGTGSLTKRGKGRLELSGKSSLLGPTKIEAGELAVNGALRGSIITVAKGAQLSGDGVIEGFVAQAGSTISPGNSIGKLTTRGDVRLQRGSTYHVELGDYGQSDLISAAGTITLLKAKLKLTLSENGEYQTSVPYKILTSKSGIRGRFGATNEGSFAFVTPTLQYAAKDVFVTLERKSGFPGLTFASVGLTKNQINTANAVEALGEGNRLFNTVLVTNVSDARKAFDSLSGEVHGSSVISSYDNARVVRDTLLSHLRQPSGTSAGKADASASSIELWGEGFGSWGRVRSNGNAASLDASIGGFILGAETLVNQNYRLGFAGGLTRNSFDIDARSSSGSNEAIFGTFYGTGKWDAINLRLGAAYAHNDIDTARSVTYPGFDDVAKASIDGASLQAFGELGYRFAWDRVQIEPFIGASVMKLEADRFFESGGAAALLGRSRTYELGTSTLALQAEMQLSDNLPLIARGMIGWRRTYGEVTPSALLVFPGAGSTFSVSGLLIDRDALVAEAGLDWKATSDISLGASYSGQIGSQAQDHAFKGNFIWKF